MLPSAKKAMIETVTRLRKLFDGLPSADDVREGWQQEVDAFEELGERAQESDRGQERKEEMDTLETMIDELEGHMDSVESTITELEDQLGIKRA